MRAVQFRPKRAVSSLDAEQRSQAGFNTMDGSVHKLSNLLFKGCKKKQSDILPALLVILYVSVYLYVHLDLQVHLGRWFCYSQIKDPGARGGSKVSGGKYQGIWR
ncbi:hypothetical protein Pmgp_01270 [Pelotomaculum propionicicum]|uniref:Uncharacterized protein n=1 Tax=Pelotomaculum propionicicum TaxID=258475 RepID=A0A4Y7RSP3_9FIRM|nr:hypothetical protein Pmgp_01270 [Pelotomaculum propionicicum]